MTTAWKWKNGFWTPERISKAARLWADGKVDAQIAHHFGKTTSSVVSMIGRNREKFPHRSPGCKPTAWPEEKIIEAAELWKRGDRVVDIERHFGHSIGTMIFRNRKKFPRRYRTANA